MMKTCLSKAGLLACLFLVACGGGSHDSAAPIAQKANVSVVEQDPGATPFIGKIIVSEDRYADLASITYTIAPKPGTFSRPVSVTYEKTWLDRNGSYSSADQRLSVVVFGLYADYLNEVNLTLQYRDGSTHAEQLAMQAAAYSGPAAVYMAPTIRTARGANSAPVVDYIFLKNRLAGPVVIDSDGNLRWVSNGPADATASMFAGQRFYVGSSTAPVLTQVQLDGAFASYPLDPPANYTDLHHDFVAGKQGLLVELDTAENGVPNIETILAEITPTGHVLTTWDMGAIISAYMRANGDDPSNFVRPGFDWFHMNSAIYDPADDTVIVSSRENFVIKIGYTLGDIKWIFGDTSKHWYVDYPSLRARALTLTSGKAPIGQHALSITPNGDLLLFNNGWGSVNQPRGTAPGITWPTSGPSRYRIDETNRSAQEVWSYDHQPSFFTDICSSVYETTPNSYLVLYASVDTRKTAVLTALDAAGNIAFEYSFPSASCAAAFIAQPIAFEALELQ